MSTPVIGREAVIQIDGNTVGYATGVTRSLEAELIKEYALGSDLPAVLESGNKTIRVSIEKMWIDDSYAQDLLNGTKVTVVIRPRGTGSGLPEITISNVVLTAEEVSYEQDAVVMESVEGEGDSITFGTQP
jgi:hypothetical protein